MPRRRTGRPTLAASALAVLATLLPGPAPAAAATSFTGTLAQAVAAVPQVQERTTGYDRRLFPHWADADRDCQNARAEVLLAETSAAVTFTTAGRCTVTTGRWTSWYDRGTWTAASDVDVDHLVPLAEAWGSGAAAWTSTRRRAFANDLGDPRSLGAVTDEVNQSKGDRDPAAWLPTYDRCRYVAEWTAVKLRWRLTADAAEKRVLTGYAASCPSTVLTVVRA